MKEILNPVRLLTVEDKWKIGSMLDNINSCNGHYTEYYYIEFDKRWESLLSQPLTKEMFVCELEEPKEMTQAEEDLWEAYTQASSKVLFEGFEINGVLLKNGNITIECIRDGFNYWTDDKEVANNIDYDLITIHDLIVEIDRYNRTGKILLNWTDNAIKYFTESK